MLHFSKKSSIISVILRLHILRFHFVLAENKVTIKKRLEAESKNPLLRLEKLVDSDHHLERQIGFCSQWCLDNLCKESLLRFMERKLG